MQRDRRAKDGRHCNVDEGHGAVAHNTQFCVSVNVGTFFMFTVQYFLVLVGLLPVFDLRIVADPMCMVVSCIRPCYHETFLIVIVWVRLLTTSTCNEIKLYTVSIMSIMAEIGKACQLHHFGACNSRSSQNSCA